MFALSLYYQWELKVQLKYQKELYSQSGDALFIPSSHELYKVREVDEENVVSSDELKYDSPTSTKTDSSSKLNLEYSLLTLQYEDEEIEQKFNKHRWGRGLISGGIAAFLVFYSIADFINLGNNSDLHLKIVNMMRIFYSTLLMCAVFMIKRGRLVNLWGNVCYVLVVAYNSYRLILAYTQGCDHNDKTLHCNIITNFGAMFIFSFLTPIFSVYSEWIVAAVGQLLICGIILYFLPKINKVPISLYFIIIFFNLFIFFGRYMLEYGTRSLFSSQYDEKHSQKIDAAKYQEILRVIKGKSRRKLAKLGTQHYGSSMSAIFDSSDSESDIGPNLRSKSIEGSSHKLLTSIIKEIDSAQRHNTRLSTNLTNLSLHLITNYPLTQINMRIVIVVKRGRVDLNKAAVVIVEDIISRMTSISFHHMFLRIQKRISTLSKQMKRTEHKIVKEQLVHKNQRIQILDSLCLNFHFLQLLVRMRSFCRDGEMGRTGRG